MVSRLFDDHCDFIKHKGYGVACYAWCQEPSFLVRAMRDNDRMGRLRHKGDPGYHYTDDAGTYEERRRTAYVMRRLGSGNTNYEHSFIRDLINDPLRFRDAHYSWLTGKGTSLDDWLEHATRHTLIFECPHQKLSDCEISNIPSDVRMPSVWERRPHWHLFIAGRYPEHPKEGVGAAGNPISFEDETSPYIRITSSIYHKKIWDESTSSEVPNPVSKTQWIQELEPMYMKLCKQFQDSLSSECYWKGTQVLAGKAPSYEPWHTEDGI